MLTAKERSVIQRVKEKQKDKSDNILTQRIKEANACIFLTVQIYTLSRELSKKYGITMERARELIHQVSGE